MGGSDPNAAWAASTLKKSVFTSNFHGTNLHVRIIGDYYHRRIFSIFRNMAFPGFSLASRFFFFQNWKVQLDPSDGIFELPIAREVHDGNFRRKISVISIGLFKYQSMIPKSTKTLNKTNIIIMVMNPILPESKAAKWNVNAIVVRLVVRIVTYHIGTIKENPPKAVITITKWSKRQVLKVFKLLCNCFNISFVILYIGLVWTFEIIDNINSFPKC